MRAPIPKLSVPCGNRYRTGNPQRRNSGPGIGRAASVDVPPRLTHNFTMRANGARKEVTVGTFAPPHRSKPRKGGRWRVDPGRLRIRSGWSGSFSSERKAGEISKPGGVAAPVCLEETLFKSIPNPRVHRIQRLFPLSSWCRRIDGFSRGRPVSFPRPHLFFPENSQSSVLSHRCLLAGSGIR